MATNPRELHTHQVSPQIAAQVAFVPLSLDVTETADVTIAAFVATRRLRLIGASYIQETDATAATSYTCQLKNGSTNLTDALDIAGLSADTAADFAGVPVGVDAELADGDTLDVVFNETGGTVTAPDRVGILLEFLVME